MSSAISLPWRSVFFRGALMLARLWADAGQCWDRCDGVTDSCTRCRPIQKRREASKQWPHSESNQRCIGPHSLLLLEENENKQFSQNVASVVYFWLISMAQFGGFSPVLFSKNGGGIAFLPIPFLPIPSRLLIPFTIAALNCVLASKFSLTGCLHVFWRL